MSELDILCIFFLFFIVCYRYRQIKMYVKQFLYQ